MRGNFYSTTGDLPETDLTELSDLLAMQLYNTLERKVYGLSRQDVEELVTQYIEESNRRRPALGGVADLGFISRGPEGRDAAAPPGALAALPSPPW